MTRINLPMEDGGEQYEQGFIVLEPGDYDFVVANRLKVEDAKSSDNKVIKVELEHTMDDGKKVKVFDNLTQTQKAYFKTFQFFRACGFSKDDISAGIELEDCYQLPLRVKIVQEIQKEGANKGEPRNLVKAYLYEKDSTDETTQPDA